MWLPQGFAHWQHNAERLDLREGEKSPSLFSLDNECSKTYCSLMTNYFAISDTHFGHEKTWSTFKRDDGSPLRAFSSTEEMDQHMIDCWNKVVGPNDVIYHLGDAVINRKFMYQLGRLNGHKRLVRGNHDIFPTTEYMTYFEEIYGVIPPNNHKKFPFIMSHVPLHRDSLERWGANVHGHLHGKRVLTSNKKPDPKYICVSVENVDYTPVSFDDILLMIKV